MTHECNEKTLQNNYDVEAIIKWTNEHMSMHNKHQQLFSA